MGSGPGRWAQRKAGCHTPPPVAAGVEGVNWSRCHIKPEVRAIRQGPALELKAVGWLSQGMTVVCYPGGYDHSNSKYSM